MKEQLGQCFENWRAAQPEGEPTLRQEIAYRAGFEDAMALMQSASTVMLAGDVHQSIADTAGALQAERV